MPHSVESISMSTQRKSKYPAPTMRRLQIFSFDPSADISMESADISRCTLQIPWEEVTPGPVGEYVEVIDLDPSSDCVYDPVDLMDGHLLASHGLAPSTGRPQFHQQMVYAVAMKTIDNFEQVLGRSMQWSERLLSDNNQYIADPEQRYVGKLRIYPHALREQNAYYSPFKKALLFGYFNATTADPGDELPGGVVFTCLSHDIIAHETTHAILDGLHRRLLDATNYDMLAFHEAFADIVAIFQHFTLPGVLLDQIQRTRGDLRVDNLLVKLASQFARATGRGGALRNALGERGPSGEQLTPDPMKLGRTKLPHERGAILVAAVFDTFLRIYENRVRDLRRIATGGTGVLPQGDIHPDLAARFANEAAGASKHVLNICIRALDYLPPVDVTFGDFLRSLITADADFYPHDERHYRLAFIESFRKRGIYPNDARALSEDSLRWNRMSENLWTKLKDCLPPPAVLRTMTLAYDNADELAKRLKNLNDKHSQSVRGAKPPKVNEMKEEFLQACWIGIGQGGAKSEEDASPGKSRYSSYLLERQFARFLHNWILGYAKSDELSPQSTTAADLLEKIGYNFGLDMNEALGSLDQKSRLRLEVHAVRPTIRLRPDGRSKVELLVLLTQSNQRDLPARPRETAGANEKVPPVRDGAGNALQYKFRGGCTLLINPEEGTVRYAIGKNIQSARRRSAHEAFLRDRLDALGLDAIERYRLRSTKQSRKSLPAVEPFALTHRGDEPGDEEYG